MKRIFFFLICIIFSFSSNAQFFHWANQFSGASDNRAVAMAEMPNGDLIIGGSFSGTVDFDPGENTFLMTSMGEDDVYVVRVDDEGKLIWASQVGGTLEVNLRNVYCDAAGNIFLTGAFKGTVDMDPGDETFELTSYGGKDVFIVQLNSSGEFEWAGQFAGIFDGTGTGVTVTASGNIYCSGYFIGVFDFDPGVGEEYFTCTGQSLYTVKLNSAHEFQWAKVTGGEEFDYCQKMCLDENENIYTIGSFKGVADFDPGDSTVLLTSAGLNDGYVSKLDSMGNFLWVRHFSSADDAFGQAITCSADGMLFFAGEFKGTTDFASESGGAFMTSAGEKDVFIGKMDDQGSMSWIRQVGGPETDVARGIAIDDFENVYTTGLFTGTCDFDPGEGNYYVTTAGDMDAFISKLDDEGTFSWAASMGGVAYEYGYSILTDGEENVYACGMFSEVADFDPGASTYYLNSLGGFDSYFCKLGTQLVGIEENPSIALKVYPNPVENIINIELDHQVDVAEVTLFNVTGQAMFKKEYHTSGMISFPFDGPVGVYFVKIVTNNGESGLIKLIKE